MVSSISLSGLCCIKPDGKPLFTNIDFNFTDERIGLVGRNGVGKTTLLRVIAGDMTPHAGCVAVNGTVALMRQDGMIHQDATLADLFGLKEALALLDLAAEGKASVEELAEADWTLGARMESALADHGLSADPDTRLANLSGGQRVRAALAAIMMAGPDFLLLDEPTNNLDRAGRDLVIALVRHWKGGAIVVSHDRELLEEMNAIAELTTLGLSRYGGNFSAYRGRKQLELDAATHDLSHAERASREVAQRAQQASERKARKDSVGARSRSRGDQPKILMDAAQGRAEASGGASQRLRDVRREAAEEALSSARSRIEVLQPIRMDIPSTGLVAGKTVLRLDAVSGGYDRSRPVIRDLTMAVTGSERILLAGPNGSGKSTLLKMISGALTPFEGAVDVRVPFAVLDQHVLSLSGDMSLLENFQQINPVTADREAYAALARFKFRADDALRKAANLSGGERLRAGLACALGAVTPPQLLILDEPTNHLDLDGIAALEGALAIYDGAILAVSHDESFVRALSPHRVIRLAG